MIIYVTGDATQPIGTGPRVIVHVCNDVGAWGKGFVLAVSKRWKAPELAFRGLRNPTLGDVQIIAVEPSLWVANMIGQHGIRSHNGVPPVRYDAIREALVFVASFARHRHASVHMPRIGAGLAGGDWSTIAAIIETTLVDISVTVYDLPR